MMSGNSKDEKAITSLNEVELYFLIDSWGAFIWRMNHEMSHGRIETKDHVGVNADIDRVRAKQAEAVQELTRVGVEQPLDENGTPTEAYWEWYRRWNVWHKGMANDAWVLVKAALKDGLTDAQVNEYRREAGISGEPSGRDFQKPPKVKHH